ncbi:MAG: hypothetical protein GTN89_08560 [Acidobacteria bacterium]|nr:hypothetical protein [Acidobacteriota bacterium]NIM63965.1 hypothetical protein [Acidobacteriota bacterium]NIO59370.1 hypothetical protein [Acidobacteriota bacterium]NIQ30406.1 hypothetical protein [Acidobacteriota bacterium]NIQ85332.1 hypothetical protein [Acidobacteriota bacterium]
MGGPVAVVVSMLFLGIALRTPVDGAQALRQESDRHRAPIDLAVTAAEDAARLARHPDAWTLQFMVGCKRESLEPIAEALDAQPNFFLLDSPDTGEGCYRVCWGVFASKPEAEVRRPFPDVLSDIDTMGWARPVGEVLP